MRLYRRLAAIADDAVPGIRRAFLDQVRRTVSAADFKAIEQAMLSGDVEAAMRAVPWKKFEEGLKLVTDRLVAVAEEANRHALEQLRAQVISGEVQVTPAGELRLFTLDQVISPQVLDYLRQQAGEMIRQITDETKYAVRRILAQAHQQGIHPRAAGRRLRDTIGLTRVQAGAVEKLRADLIKKGTPEGRVDALVSNYARRQLRIRAEVIARTETITAMNRGQQAVWAQAMDRQELSGDRWEREWVAIVPSDGRTCPICEGLDAKRAPIDGTFPGGYTGPTAHPQCRCTERLVKKET